MLTRALQGRRVGLGLAGAAVLVGMWTVGPPAPQQAAAGPYFGLMCSDVTSAHFDRLGNTITCIESVGGHAPRRHVNSWRLCVKGPGGVDACRTSTSACAWINGHTPPSSSGSCGHSCHSVWRGYTGFGGASCSFVGHYDTPHVHVGLRLGTRTRPSCPSGQHRDGGSGSCHSHLRPACTADGTYTAISGTGHTTGKTAVCGPPPCPAGQHRDGGVGSCHSHLRPACTTTGTYTAISGTGHTTATTSVCGPPRCRVGQHRDGGVGSCHSHLRPACTADGTYTAISGTGHTTATTSVCGPPRCRVGQHRDGGVGSCHGHPRPACTTTGTYTAISGTGHTSGKTAVCGLPPCPAGEHRDGGSGTCHGHLRPACTTTGTYTAISGTGHTSGKTAVCGLPPCPAGEHRDGGSGTCHGHPKPACTTTGTYTAISGTGHTTAATSVCGSTPDPDRDGDEVPECSTGLSLEGDDREAFGADLWWETLVDIKPQGPPGEPWPPHPDVPGGSKYLVVADSPVWTVIDPAAQPWAVATDDGCVWNVTGIQVEVTQLVPWHPGHRRIIENNAAARPDTGLDTYLKRWDGLSATQRAQAQQFHVSRSVSRSCDFVDAQDPALARTACSWQLPWAGVWSWSVRACFEGVGGGHTYEECPVLDRGVEWFLNIVDYTRQITLLADVAARE